jgi:lipopolysaccharide transport protein LptA
VTRLWRGVGCALLLLQATSALADEPPSSQGRELRRPTTVTADHLEVSLKERRAIYTGNVVAKTPDLTVTADRMDFDFDEKMEAVERMVAIGNVEISHGEGNRAASERATYYVLQEKVVLEGHPRAWRQENMVSGTRITVFFKDDRQVVEGDEGERVTAIIYPKRQPGQAR